MTSKLQSDLLAARRIGTPLVAIHTPDPTATIGGLIAAFSAQPLPGPDAIAVAWDCYRGLTPLVAGDSEAWVGSLEEPTFAPAAAIDAVTRRLPANSVAFFHDLHRHLDPAVIATLRVARDALKADRRMLVILSPNFTLPPELEHDVSVYEEPLPDREVLSAIVDDVLASANAALDTAIALSPEARERVVDGLTGLSAFAAEQVAYQTLEPTGFNLPALWERKKSAIENVPGLSLSVGGDTLDTLGGLAGFKRLAAHVFGGKRRPRLVIRVDEIEKHFAGLGVRGGPGDNTGVTQDALNVFLTNMEDHKWTGLLLVGPPGAAKTAATRAMGATYGVPTLSIDLGATKTSALGESEARIRAVMRTALGLGGEYVIVVATCNKLDVLPPELQRRFTLGVMYCGLPTDEERDAIWLLQLAAHGLPLDGPRPRDTDWTGADVRNCCAAASDFGLPLAEAAECYVTPVVVIDPEAVEALEVRAHGKWKSASTGRYHVMKSRKPMAVTAKRGVA